MSTTTHVYTCDAYTCRLTCGDFRAELKAWTLGEYREAVYRWTPNGWTQVHVAMFPKSHLGDMAGRERRYLESLLASHARGA